ncbi:MAG: hypothetical protein R3C19_04275 [Planctomycetaceae bacterium]
MRTTANSIAALWMAGWISVSAQPALCQPSARLLSGRSLQDSLAAELTLTVSDARTADLLQTLQRDTGIPVILDRRIDPTADPGSYSGTMTIAQLLRSIAESLNCGVSYSEHFVYIGPKRAAESLRTVIELRRQEISGLRGIMPADTYRAIVADRPASWPRLAQPRELLTAAAPQAGLQIENADVVPYDLWRAGELPDVSFAEYASVILIQFDLTFHIDEQGSVLRVEPLPEAVRIEQKHRVAARRKDAVQQRWQTEFADLEFSWQGSTAVVAATIEQHERLDELIREP